MKVTVEVLKQESYLLPSAIDEWIELLNRAKTEAAKQCLTKVSVEIIPYNEYDSSSANLIVFGEREENAEEKKARKIEEVACKQREIAWAKQRLKELETE